MPVIDTAIAHHLLEATQAAQLLGARYMLVGVAPEIAQTIVQLGMDLSALITRSNLQEEIAYTRGAGVRRS